MVFNLGMNDAVLIRQLGGPARVAELLGYDKAKGGIQRVQNWLTRGIPPRVKLERPDLFMVADSLAGTPAGDEEGRDAA